MRRFEPPPRRKKIRLLSLFRDDIHKLVVFLLFFLFSIYKYYFLQFLLLILLYIRLLYMCFQINAGGIFRSSFWKSLALSIAR